MSSPQQIMTLAGDVLYTHAHAGASMRDAVEAAVAQGISLRQADLSQVDLSGARLHGADLGDACLAGARLSGADLRDARLQRIDMSDEWQGWLPDGRDLRKTCFQGTDLRGADLTDAILCTVSPRDGAPYSFDFRSANLSRACLDGARLSGAMMRGMDLRDVCLRGVHLREADLRDTDLSAVDFGPADLCMTVFCRARLRGADLREVVDRDGTCLRRADLSGARIKRDGWETADFCGASLDGTGLHWIPSDMDGIGLHWMPSYTDESIFDCYDVQDSSNTDQDPCLGKWDITTGTLHAVTRAPLRIDGLGLPVILFDGHLQIGWRACTLADWAGFDDADILALYDGDMAALHLWSHHKAVILAAAGPFAMPPEASP